MLSKTIQTGLRKVATRVRRTGKPTAITRYLTERQVAELHREVLRVKARRRSTYTTALTRIFKDALQNPFPSTLGGSVSACIRKITREKPQIVDPGAYCAAIADKTEPGWRSGPRKKPKKRAKKRARKNPYAAKRARLNRARSLTRL